MRVPREREREREERERARERERGREGGREECREGVIEGIYNKQALYAVFNLISCLLLGRGVPSLGIPPPQSKCPLGIQSLR